jgi:Tfp pilus assembly protein FimT
MLITVVIIGVLAALSVPSLQRAQDRATFKAGERIVSLNLKKARSYAISQKVPFGVHLDTEQRVVTVFENRSDPATATFDSGDSIYSVDTLPEEMQYVYTDAENSAIVFHPNGSAQVTGYGNIFLAGETQGMMAYFSISVLASTGRINTYSHYYVFEP